MDILIVPVIIVVVLALWFTLTNGLLDASSVVATFIACGAGTTTQAVLLASAFGLLGALFGGSAVADTVAKIVNAPVGPGLLNVLMAALMGSIAWNLTAWQFGLPSSSTHSLVGGLVGAVWVSSGYEHVLWGWHELISLHQLTGLIKIVAALIISPALGFTLAYGLQKFMKHALVNARYSINKWLKRASWVLAGLLAFVHGANDTQKVMGLIGLALLAGNLSTQQSTPVWVRLAAGTIMFGGTMFGGWSVMKTLGRRIFDIRPIHNLNSQLSSGGAVLLATALGLPISTTHVVASSVIGVGAADEFRMVKWHVGKEMISAWLVTIPASATISALLYYPICRLSGIG